MMNKKISQTKGKISNISAIESKRSIWRYRDQPCDL